MPFPCLWSRALPGRLKGQCTGHMSKQAILAGIYIGVNMTQVGPKLGRCWACLGARCSLDSKRHAENPHVYRSFWFFCFDAGLWLLHGLKLRHVRPTCAQARPSCAMLLSPSWTQAVQVGLKFSPVGPKSACVRPNLRPRTAEFAPSRLRLGHLGPCSSPCVPATILLTRTISLPAFPGACHPPRKLYIINLDLQKIDKFMAFSQSRFIKVIIEVTTAILKPNGNRR